MDYEERLAKHSLFACRSQRQSTLQVFLVEVIADMWVCVFTAEGDVSAQPWGGPFIPVCLTFCRVRSRAMAEAWDTFISPDESCDSLEPSFCGLSVWVSFTLTTWMTETGCREGEASYHRSHCLMARLFARCSLFHSALLSVLPSFIIRYFAGHMRLWDFHISFKQISPVQVTCSEPAPLWPAIGISIIVQDTSGLEYALPIDFILWSWSRSSVSYLTYLE